MNLQELLVAQIPLLLLSIGYFVKRVYDIKSKKIEIKYGLFQEKKIAAITKFIEHYYFAEKTWKHFSIWDVAAENTTSIDLDKIIMPALDNLNNSLIELTLYLADDEKTPFVIIRDNQFKINRAVCDIFFNRVEGHVVEKANHYDQVKTDTTKISQEQLVIIGEKTRKYYSS